MGVDEPPATSETPLLPVLGPCPELLKFELETLSVPLPLVGSQSRLLLYEVVTEVLLIELVPMLFT